MLPFTVLTSISGLPRRLAGGGLGPPDALHSRASNRRLPGHHGADGVRARTSDRRLVLRAGLDGTHAAAERRFRLRRPMIVSGVSAPPG